MVQADNLRSGLGEGFVRRRRLRRESHYGDSKAIEQSRAYIKGKTFLFILIVPLSQACSGADRNSNFSLLHSGFSLN